MLQIFQIFTLFCFTFINFKMIQAENSSLKLYQSFQIFSGWEHNLAINGKKFLVNSEMKLIDNHLEKSNFTDVFLLNLKDKYFNFYMRKTNGIKKILKEDKSFKHENIDKDEFIFVSISIDKLCIKCKDGNFLINSFYLTTGKINLKLGKSEKYQSYTTRICFEIANMPIYIVNPESILIDDENSLGNKIEILKNYDLPDSNNNFMFVN